MGAFLVVECESEDLLSHARLSLWIMKRMKRKGKGMEVQFI